MPKSDPAKLKAAFEQALTTCIKTRYSGNAHVDQAVRYALAGGGKRVRPVLCLLTAEALGVASDIAMPAALALEFVHTYSLVHDDLPCMDNDDLRRGRPTVHKAHGEANALLAGDALLTDAFALLADEEGGFGFPAALPPAARVRLVRELAEAAGGAGMVLGQGLDLYWTARTGADRPDLDGVHLRKTGYLLGAAAAMGGAAAGAGAAALVRLRTFGRLLGLAFQVLDDLLDEASGIGKSPGKDRATGKLTYLTLMSREEAQTAADRYTEDAIKQLVDVAGLDPDPLYAFAHKLLQRTH